MTDVRHLKSSGTPGWMELGQINAIMQVSGETGGQRDTVCLPALLELLARLREPAPLLHGMADSWLTSLVLHCLQVPTDASQRALAEVPCELDHGECDECLGSLAEEGAQQPGLSVQCQGPSKAPCHFLLCQTCPAGPTWKSTPSACPIWPRHPLPPLFLPALNSFLFFFPATLSLHLSELPACEWLLKWSICPRIPIYQPVGAHIDCEWGGVGSYIQYGGDRSWSCTCIRHLD